MHPKTDQPPPADYADQLREAVLEAEDHAKSNPIEAVRFYAMGLRMAAGLYGLTVGTDPDTRQKLDIPDRPDRPAPTPLPDLRAGVYRHYKGPHYLVLGYGHDANQEGRNVVIYVGLELDGAKQGARLAARDVADFFAVVDPTTGVAVRGFERDVPATVQRFTYVGPTYTFTGLP